MSTDKKKLIIVDDHPFLRDGVKNFLNAHEQFEIIAEFSETRSLINSYNKEKPDAIILDLNLPDLDGIRSCELLKKKYPDCKILAFTQYENRDKELDKAGFDGYVVKSETNPLVEALIAVLNGTKYFNSGSAEKVLKPNENGGEKDLFIQAKKLTTREIEIVHLMAQDYSNREIGEKLYISESTVETHRKHIKEKLQVKTRRELNIILKKYFV